MVINSYDALRCFRNFCLVFLLAASVANEDQVFILQRTPTLSSERIDPQMKKITRTIGTLMLASAMLMFSCTGGTEGDNTSDNTDAGQILFLSHYHYS